ncbi:MAG: LysE family transporter [Pseudomonadota bacterium]
MSVTALLGILFVALVGAASPGPATVAIATTSAGQGAKAGLAFASGVVAGSFTWSIAAALGLSAVMLANAWLLDIIRYAGASYLAYLAWKSARAAWGGTPPTLQANAKLQSHKTLFLKGLFLHLTNPKAILFFGALFAFVIKPGTPWETVFLVVAAVGAQSTVIFLGYAILFSRPIVRAAYARAARGIQGACAVVFVGFSVQLITARLGT